METVKAKIISDDNDTTIIQSVLKDAEYDIYSLSGSTINSLMESHNSLIVVQISNNDPSAIRTAFSMRDVSATNKIFVVNCNSTTIVSSLARMGYNDIFVFPNEIYKFNSHLNEILQNISISNANSVQNEIIEESSELDSFAANSGKMQDLIKMAKRVAINPSANLLILGETGTGKGMLAKAIHNFSDNSNSPFIDIICTAIPHNLLESELFGYEKGAFTDAKSSKIGLFEMAEDGTIFLDEIADLNLDLQSKLLRVIEKKYFRRIGGVKDIPINARIISATNKNLLEQIERREFRRDLYYRLNVVSLELPPLKQRKEDIIHLANKFIVEYCEKFGKMIKPISTDIEQFLMEYSWPGNIRELKHAIERSILLTESNKITEDIIKASVYNTSSKIPVQRLNLSAGSEVKININYQHSDLEKVTRIYAKEVLNKEGGNKSRTAKILNISRPKLDKLLKDSV